MKQKTSPNIAAIIVGAGAGNRARHASSNLPKQFYKISGKTIFQHTVDAFSQCDKISNIICVVPENNLSNWALPYYSGLSEQIRLSIVNGDKTRQKSVLKGLLALKSTPKKWDIVLVHDAARPFLSKALIESVIADSIQFGASIPALPVVDSVKRAKFDKNKNIFIENSVERNMLYQAQTPQGFDFQGLLYAHEKALNEENINFSDDAEVYQTYSGAVHLTPGEKENWKITSVDDIFTAKNLLAIRESQNQMVDVRVGHGYDVHAFQPGGHVILCGARIPHNRSLKGHSDADVGLHALTDAILGALTEGDIGQHFPPSDPKWKGASSDQFLSHACCLVSNKNAQITHLDVTLICEAPKISAYRDEMRKCIADITNVPIHRISVKATTSEGLGFTGRQEGIAAHATATVVFEKDLTMSLDVRLLKCAQATLKTCQKARIMIATAESCTGGLIMASLTAISGSSQVVDSGFITYSNQAKTRLVGVPEELIITHGAVSKPIAIAMAEGALANSYADIAISTTGIAGPTGGTQEKPIGTVHMACAATNKNTIHQYQQYGELSRDEIRIRAALDAMGMIQEQLAVTP